MDLTDGCWFLISCVIQHYAPVVGWGGGRNRCIMLIMTLLKLWGDEQREQRKSKRERRDGTDTSSVMWAGGQIPPPQTRPNQLKSPSQHNTTVWALDSPRLPLHKIHMSKISSLEGPASSPIYLLNIPSLLLSERYPTPPSPSQSESQLGMTIKNNSSAFFCNCSYAMLTQCVWRQRDR